MLSNIFIKIIRNLLFYTVLLHQSAFGQSDQVWYKPGAFREQLKTDIVSCYTKHGRDDAGGKNCMRSMGWTMVELSKVQSARKECRDRFPNPKGDLQITSQYFDCLRNLGWEDEPIVWREIRELNIATRNVCKKTEYEFIEKVVPCRVSEIILEHMTNGDRVGENNKALFLRYFGELDVIREKILQKMRNGGMKDRKLYEYRISTSDAKVDDARINLINGRYTFGEFNRKRKENEAEFQKMVIKVDEEVAAFVNSKLP